MNEYNKNSSLSNNGIKILGNNFGDYKMYLEIEKMNKMRNQPPVKINLPKRNDDSKKNILTIQTDNNVGQIQNTNPNNSRTPFVYTPMKRIENLNINTNNNNNNFPNINQRPYSNFHKTERLQTDINESPNEHNNNYTLINEINSIKNILKHSIDNQQLLQAKINDYNKIINEQENIIKLNNLKLNEHDNKLTEVLLSFNNYLKLNERSNQLVTEFQKKLDEKVMLSDYNDLKSTVYSLNSKNENGIKLVNKIYEDLNRKVDEVEQSNNNYQKFTMEQMNIIKQNAMDNRLKQQNELIKYEEGKENRINSQFDEVKGYIEMIKNNQKDESIYRKKMIDNFRIEVLDILNEKDNKILQNSKENEEKENKIINLITTSVDILDKKYSKAIERYEIELKSLRSIIETMNNKTENKINKDNKVSEENLANLRKDVLAHKTKIAEIEKNMKETVEDLESRLLIGKGGASDYVSKFDLLSSTLKKYMTDNLDTINNKCDQLSKEFNEKINIQVKSITDNSYVNIKEINNKLKDIDEKLVEFNEYRANHSIEFKNRNNLLFKDFEKNDDTNVQMIRDYITKRINEKSDSINKNIKEFQDLVNALINEKLEENKNKILDEQKSEICKLKDLIHTKFDGMLEQIDDKTKDDITLIEGKIQQYVMDYFINNKDKFNIKEEDNDNDKIKNT